MVYQVSFQDKKDGADPHCKFTQSFFVESESEVRPENVRGLVERFSGGDFGEGTIEIEACPDLNPDELRKNSRIYKLTK